MASGKKGKKTKGKTLALTDFLQETTGSLPSQPIRKSTASWADEIDDYDASDAKFANVVLPTAPKASRDYDDIANKVPKEPPYIAYLSNLPYDVNEEEIGLFFKNMKISNMRIPRDERPSETPKLKGFGYVEFEDRESLMSALIIPDTTLKNRRIRIEVAANAENDRRRGGRMGISDRLGSADTGGDWRSTNRPEAVEERRGMGGSFNRDNMREGGRDKEYGGFNRDRDREGGFSRDRDFGRDSTISRNRDQDDRSGSWRDGDRPNRDNDRDRGFSRANYRDSDRNRFDRDDRDDRDRRGGSTFRRYDHREEKNGINRSSNRSDKDDGDSDRPSSEPRRRPRLQLAPRTKPIEQAALKSEPAVASASIFGSAKPVDTTERDRQIEEKLLRAQEETSKETGKESKEKDKGGEEGGDKRNIERGRPISRRDDRDRETNIKDREPPSEDRKNVIEDNRKPSQRSDYRSPDNKKKVEKQQDRQKREEKRDRSEKEMPKFQEPEPPNFQGNNKFAVLPDDEGF